MRKKRGAFAAIVVFFVLLFGASLVLESNAWARAGGGSSSGSRGSRSFSSPSQPSRPSSPSPSPSAPSPGYKAPGATPMPGSPSSGRFGGSPFWSGVAGGVAGGFLGSMLFGGRSYGAGGPMGGGFGGSGIGLFDLLLIGAIIYFGWRFLRRRREQTVSDAYSYSADDRGTQNSLPGSQQWGNQYSTSSAPEYSPQIDGVQKGFEDIRRLDPSFSEETFKETAEDLFFRIQAAWMNRSPEGIEKLLTPEMTQYFTAEFARMKQEGKINRLENIAVRKVEPAEVWQEEGRDYITIFFTANLLDYVTDDKTGAVIEGDKLNPVKFQEFWTFSRSIGSSQWQLTGINQLGEPSPQTH